MTTPDRIAAAVELSRKTMVLNALKFEHEYATSNGWTVKKLREHGRIVVPCRMWPRCEHPKCTGWNSVPGDLLDDLKMMGQVPAGWTWPQEIA